jgi:hypothetical protein
MLASFISPPPPASSPPPPLLAGSPKEELVEAEGLAISSQEDESRSTRVSDAFATPTTPPSVSGGGGRRKRKRDSITNGTLAEGGTVKAAFDGGCYISVQIHRKQFLGIIFDAKELQEAAVSGASSSVLSHIEYRRQTREDISPIPDFESLKFADRSVVRRARQQELQQCFESTDGDATPQSRKPVQARIRVSRRPKRVVVIGAGFAGLAASLELQTFADCEVVLLEARERVGGRCVAESSLSDGQITEEIVDMGPTWLLDEGGVSPLLEECRAAGLSIQVTKPLPDSGAADPLLQYAKDAACPEVEVASALLRIVEHLESVDAGKKGGCAIESTHSLLSFGHQLSLGLNAPLQHGPERQPQTPEVIMIEEGFGMLLSQLADSVSDLRLGWPVSRIVRGRTEDPAASSTGGSFDCCVYGDRGESIAADAVIVTVPVGVLKEGRIQFEPSLPEPTLKALSELCPVLVNKISLQFEVNFWGASLEDRLVARSSSGAPPSDLYVFRDLSSVCKCPTILATLSGSAVRTCYSNLAILMLT